MFIPGYKLKHLKIMCLLMCLYVGRERCHRSCVHVCVVGQEQLFGELILSFYNLDPGLPYWLQVLLLGAISQTQIITTFKLKTISFWAASPSSHTTRYTEGLVSTFASLIWLLPLLLSLLLCSSLLETDNLFMAQDTVLNCGAPPPSSPLVLGWMVLSFFFLIERLTHPCFRMARNSALPQSSPFSEWELMISLTDSVSESVQLCCPGQSVTEWLAWSKAEVPWVHSAST